MRKREGEQLSGRYIKASDAKILEKVKLTEFSFDEISSTPVASLDNIHCNVMKTELHEVEEIHSVVREHDTFDVELRSPELIRPSLRPIDFTYEWKKIKERATQKRELRMEDEDDVEFEAVLQKMESQTKNEDGSEENRSEDAYDSEEEDENIPSDNPFKFKKEEDSEDVVIAGIADQISQLATSKDEDINELSSHVKKIEQDETTLEESFIPVEMSSQKSFDESESIASDRYKQMIDVRKEHAEELERAMNEARAQGYEEGFIQGEEKASIQVQQHATEVIQNLGELVAELEGLKKTILENTQENFYEIAQAVAESLIRREFSVQPEVFADVLRRAIADLVPDDKIRVAVHPDTYAQLMTVELDGLRESLVKDENMKPGDFRIDSQLSVVDGNIKEMIQDLLEQVDMQIFDEMKDKAG